MTPDLFLADLQDKPDRLRSLRLADSWAFLPPPPPHVVLLGMGSSHYANLVAAARLRAAGVLAVAELASSDLLPRVGPDTVVIAVSASAGSAETVDAVDRLGCPFVALANRPGPLTERAGRTVWMQAGEERGGVACRSFQHTLALLLELVRHLTGGPEVPVDLAVAATEHLLETESAWRPALDELLLGPDGTHVVAPARRLSSALQSALMLREGPRLPRGGLRDGRLEPCRRLPHQDDRLPDAAARRVPLGAAAAGLDDAARQHRGRRRRRPPRRRARGALPARPPRRRTSAHRDPGRRARRRPRAWLALTRRRT